MHDENYSKTYRLEGFSRNMKQTIVQVTGNSMPYKLQCLFLKEKELQCVVYKEASNRKWNRASSKLQIKHLKHSSSSQFDH